jgi:hypothetical protein
MRGSLCLGEARLLFFPLPLNPLPPFLTTPQHQAPPAYAPPPSAASAAAAAAAAAALGAALGGGSGGGGNASDPYLFAAGLAADALRAGAAPGGMLEKAGALFKGGWGAFARGGGGGGGSGTGSGDGGGRAGSPGAAFSGGGGGGSGGRAAGSWFGLGPALHVSTSYVATKLALLATPWARRWSYTRVREGGGMGSGGGGSGGPYAPPSRDVHAADLYIPLMAALTLALLRGVAAVAAGRFTPDTLAGAVSAVFSAWALHAAALKGALWALGASAAAPFSEILAYAGYPAVHGAAACAVRAASDWRVVQARLAAGGGGGGGSLAALAGGGGDGGSAPAPPAGSASAAVAASGGWLPAAVTAYGAACAGVFLVRSLKRVLFQDGAGRRGGSSPSSNYILLLVWGLQWPLVWWMGRGCRIPVPK